MLMSGTLDDAANIEAINRYITEQKPLTPAAAKARDRWIQWHDALGWYDKGFPSVDIYSQARNIRNAYNLANAVTVEDKKLVKEIQQTGLSSEQLRGEADRRMSDGNYNEVPPEPEPWIPTKTKIVLGVGALAVLALKVVKGIYLDPFLKTLRR